MSTEDYGSRWIFAVTQIVRDELRIPSAFRKSGMQPPARLPDQKAMTVRPASIWPPVSGPAGGWLDGRNRSHAQLGMAVQRLGNLKGRGGLRPHRKSLSPTP